MKILSTLPVLAILLSGCGGPDKYADNAATPDLATISETPGDWSQLRPMIGQTPDESGLLRERSPISVDLNALLGSEAGRFRTAMAGASPLVSDGAALVTLSPSRDAFLAIVPADHALHVGLRGPEGWRTYRTPGADSRLPPQVQALLSR
jgi:hypothetical protein